MCYNVDNEKEVNTMANNIHKKMTYEDKFARNFYCEGARLRELRANKKAQRKTMREYGKKIIREAIYN